MAADGISIAIGGAAFGALCALAGDFIKARFSKTRIEPQPLRTQEVKAYVTCEECRAHRDRIAARFDAQAAAVSRVERQIVESNQRIIERFDRLNERVSPIAETCAATKQAVTILLQEQSRHD